MLLGLGLICDLKSGKFLADKVMLVSSANILGEALSRQLGKSLMYIKNNKRPSMLPCGTPQVIDTRNLKRESFISMRDIILRLNMSSRYFLC